jgi:DNA-binding MarR family transcriptional regulator
MAKLPRAPLAVWFVLWRFERDGVTRIAVRALARLAGCSTRQVTRAITHLESEGLVKVVYAGGKNAGCSVYRVTPVSA